MATVNDVIVEAMKKSGIVGQGQVPDSGDMQSALLDLSDMLAQWNQRRWLIWHLLDMGKVSTGANFYTVGSGGDFNVSVPPRKIEAAYLRQQQNAGLPVDYAIKIIPSYEEFSTINLKTLVSFSMAAFLDSSYPLAKLYFNPVPNATVYELHIVIRDAYPLTLTLNQSLTTLPPEAVPAMKFNLARRLRQAFGKGLRPDIELNRLADDSLQVLRDANYQIPELELPTAIIRPGLYNILGDTFY